MTRFLYFYLRSMRLYYCFVTGTATLVGLVMAHMVFDPAWSWRDGAALFIGYLAWGVNQIFSDWYDRREDAVNAPHRPMITGELAPRPALCLSGFLMAVFALTAYFISPFSLLILFAGGLLNLLYSLLKKVPVLDTFVYAAAITCCSLFGMSVFRELPEYSRFLPLFLFLNLPPHILMCHNSYFKDIEGDRAAGLRTLPVLHPRFSLWAGMILSAGWTLLLSSLYVIAFALCPLPITDAGLFPLFLHMVLMLFLTFELFRHLWKKEYHAATLRNCQLCVTWLWFFPVIVSISWFIGAFCSVLLIELLYRWYPDEKE